VNHNKKWAVVGSGPAGFAVANILLDLGIEVTLIDANLEENDEYIFPNLDRLSLKTKFDSDLAYRHFPKGPEINVGESEVKQSFEGGGLSSIWGATILPYTERDITNWPLNLSQLKESYQFISKKIPVTSSDFSSSSDYMDFSSRDKLIIPDEINKLITSIKFKCPDISVNQSQISIENSSKSTNQCIYCNECFAGCRYNSIWSSKSFFDNSKLKKFDKIRVLSLSDSEDCIKITYCDLEGTIFNNLQFSKIFLATGPVETFRILSESGLAPKNVELLDSGTFYKLFFRLKNRSKTVTNYSLSKFYIRLQDENLIHPHFQFYEMDSHKIDILKKNYKLLKLVPKFLLNYVFSYFLLCIGYMNSEITPRIAMSRDQNGNINLVPKIYKEKRQKSRLIAKKLEKELKKVGIFSFRFLEQNHASGSGTHYGGWLPMGAKCDLQGRPYNTKNIHIVDSSIFNDIPAGPITFTIMANSARIGREVWEEEFL
jgi:hypothetical protein